MHNKYPNLLSPAKIGRVELRNKTVMAAMGMSQADNGFVNKAVLNHYAERAKGGVGAIIVEVTCVDAPLGLNTKGMLVIDDDKYIPGMKQLADVIHDGGSKAFLQISHTGRGARRAIIGAQPVGPSAVAMPYSFMMGLANETPRELTVAEIKAIEEEYAKTETPVVSNNSAHRWTPDVPMVVPEINPEHFDVIEFQKKRLGTTRGFIAVKPNCSIQSYAPALTAWKEFEPYEVVATTYQAISGAGKTFKEWPEMIENIIPYIGGEEEKSEQEPLRIWGKIEDGVIVKAQEPKITCQCIRVPVLNGHTAAVFVKFRKKPTKEQLIEKLVNFKGFPQEAELPSAPKQFIQYMEEDNRPQVQLDVNFENGMGVSIGRIREDSVYDFKFVGLSHNTVRGAAGGAVLCAETLKAKGFITKK